MPAQYYRTLLDYDGEATTMRIVIPEINAGNIADIVTQTANLGTAINGLTLGALGKLGYGNFTDGVDTEASDPFAQREMKWLVSYEDTLTGKVYRVEIGTADLSHLDPNNRDRANIGDAAEVDAFITAFETLAVAPDTANPVEVKSIIPVGRNT
jgi:hypothetical protein